MNYYKSLFASSIIISVMILFFLFNSYDGSADYDGGMLYYSFIISTRIGFLLIGCIICLEFMKWLLKVNWSKFSMFILSFTWLFNIYLFFIWLTSVLIGMQATKSEWWIAIICLISGIILFIYQRRRVIKHL